MESKIISASNNTFFGFTRIKADIKSETTGVFYPRTSLELAMKEYRERISQEIAIGEFFPGAYVSDYSYKNINLMNVTHKIIDIYLNYEGILKIQFKLLETPMGLKFINLLGDNPEHFGIKTSMEVILSDEKIATDIWFNKFDIESIE